MFQLRGWTDDQFEAARPQDPGRVKMPRGAFYLWIRANPNSGRGARSITANGGKTDVWMRKDTMRDNEIGAKQKTGSGDDNTAGKSRWDKNKF